jgi:hypothetical protein
VVLAFGKPSWALYSVMFLLFYEEDKEERNGYILIVVIWAMTDIE